MVLDELPDNQGERRQAAATEVEFLSELNGCLPFALPCGLDTEERLCAISRERLYAATPQGKDTRVAYYFPTSDLHSR